MKSIAPSYVTVAVLLAVALLPACNLKVEDLPVNEPPVIGEIVVSPEQVIPADTLRFSISASDAEDDPLNFTWNDQGRGSWVDGIYTDSIVDWVAPNSLVGIDSIVFSVLVFDYDPQHPAVGKRTLYTSERHGMLDVLLRDLDGTPVLADSLAVIGEDTLRAAAPTDSFHFESVPWGIQRLLAFQTETHYGAGPLLTGGYPEALLIRPDTLQTSTLKVAARSSCLVPGVVGPGLGDLLISDLQSGIDWCESESLDELLLIGDDFFMPAQSIPQGSAALVLDERDLHIRPFPGTGPIWLNAAADLCEIGFYLAGRTEACKIEGIGMTGAADAGAWLHESGGFFLSCRFEGNGSKSIQFKGRPGDRLGLASCELLGGEYGIFQEGGQLEAEQCLIAGGAWYGIYLRAEASATLDRLSLVDHDIAALIAENATEVTLERSILSGNRKGCFSAVGTPPELSCNIFWDNGTNLSGVDPGMDFIEADPLFCDEANGDWRVDAASPAQTESCGPLGAYGDCDSEGSPFLEDF